MLILHTLENKKSIKISKFKSQVFFQDLHDDFIFSKDDLWKL